MFGRYSSGLLTCIPLPGVPYSCGLPSMTDVAFGIKNTIDETSKFFIGCSVVTFNRNMKYVGVKYLFLYANIHYKT